MAERAKILIIEDDPSVRTALELTLKRPEWQVETAGSAEEAMTLCRMVSFDLFLVDKNFTNRSGVDFVHEIRKKESDAAVIIITGYASTKSAMALVHLGIDAYLEKPFNNIFEIAEKVAASLEKLKVRREKERLLAGLDGDPTEERYLPSMQNASQTESMSNSLILVASPNEEDRGWLEKQLQVWGIVESVTSSQEVLGYIGTETPDVVIVDFYVTNPNIFDLVVALREMVPDAACLVTLERPPLRTLTRLIDIGIAGVMEKPFDRQYFYREMRKIFQTSVLPMPEGALPPDSR